MKQLPEKHHFRVLQFPLNFAEVTSELGSMVRFTISACELLGGRCHVGRLGCRVPVVLGTCHIFREATFLEKQMGQQLTLGLPWKRQLCSRPFLEILVSLLFYIWSPAGVLLFFGIGQVGFRLRGSTVLPRDLAVLPADGNPKRILQLVT